MPARTAEDGAAADAGGAENNRQERDRGGGRPEIFPSERLEGRRRLMIPAFAT